MSQINLCINLHNEKNGDFKISVKSTDTWNDVKHALQKSVIEVPPEKIELFFGSSLCKNEDSLSNASVTENSVIHCFIDKGVADVPEKMSSSEVEALEVNVLRLVTRSNFEEYMTKQQSLDNLAVLIKQCPAIMDDPECLASFQDTAVLTSMVYGKGFRSLISEKPALGRVLEHLCKLAKMDNAPPVRARSNGYALDDMSDDDEGMDIDQDDGDRGSSQAGNRARSADFLPITPAQLAAALANATGSSNSQNAQSSSAPRSGLPTPPSTSTPFNTPGLASSSATGAASPGTSAGMTTEVFSQALQNALAASARRAGTASTAETSGSSEQPPTDNSQPPPEYLESMQLMREIGINDDNMAVQALRATNGDVQAAINLIFAQWMAED